MEEIVTAFQSVTTIVSEISAASIEQHSGEHAKSGEAIKCLISSCENIISLAEFYPFIYTSPKQQS